jgi:hypothetical protein
MKFAVISESPADEAAIRVLVDALLGETTAAAADHYQARRGWTSVLRLLPTVLKNLHYHQRDVEGLVVVLDSDRSPVHLPSHDMPGQEDAKCRLCTLRKSIRDIEPTLRPVAGRSPIQVAIGLAVPAIEAWWRCGHDPHVTEAAWLVALQSGYFPYDPRRLKIDVYGTDVPPLAMETQRMLEEAQRLAQNLVVLERSFPNGFGPLAQAVRRWIRR